MTQAVLFDLDGTLVDTAPDLAGALNRMLARRGLAAVPLSLLRPVASSGARGMLGIGFGIGPGHADYESLRQEFFDEYESELLGESALFDGVEALLDALESRGLPWGIVTNKIARFTQPLVGLLGLDARAGCVVSGDTTPHPKPHPAPLIEAARQLNYFVCEQIDTGQRCDKEASMVKLFASEMAERVCSEGIQIHGGAGYTTLHAVERHWRDARLTKIFEGTSEIQKRIISDRLLGRGRN